MPIEGSGAPFGLPADCTGHIGALCVREGKCRNDPGSLYETYGKMEMDDVELMRRLLPNTGPHPNNNTDACTLGDMLVNLAKGFWDLLTFQQNAAELVNLLECQYPKKLPPEKEIREQATRSIVSFIESGASGCACSA